MADQGLHLLAMRMLEAIAIFAHDDEKTTALSSSVERHLGVGRSNYQGSLFYALDNGWVKAINLQELQITNSGKHVLAHHKTSK